MHTTVQETKSTDRDPGQQEFEKNPQLPSVNRFEEKQTAKDVRSLERPKTTDDAYKVTTACLEELNEALKDGKSEVMENYLSFLAKFHSYSPSNNFLIRTQCPHATHVAGYDKWKELGRQVRRGEKGISIFRPIIKTRLVDVTNENGETEQKELKRPSGFSIGKVFDISQTDGDEIPSTAPITGDPGEYLPRLEALVDKYSIELSYENLPGGALGMSTGGRIRVRPDLDPPTTFAVLAHELAHELLHKGERRNETDRTVRETEAEAVSFVVSKATGLQCSTRSSDYIALYQGDSDILKESLKFIQRTASKIIWGMQKEVTDDDNSVAF